MNRVIELAKNVKLVWVLLLAIPIVIYGFSSIYIRNSADDYCLANSLHSYGALGAVNYWRETWTGRYTTIFVASLSAYFSPAISTSLVVILLVTWWFSTVKIIQYVLSKRNLRNGVLFLSCVISTLFIASILVSLSNYQPLYFQSAIPDYFLPIVLVSGIVYVLLYFPDHFWASPVLAALSFIASGTLELVGVFQVVFLVLLLVFEGDNVSRRPLIWALVATIVGIMVVVSAPGNAVRRALFPSPNYLLVPLYGIQWSLEPLAEFYRLKGVFTVFLTLASWCLALCYFAFTYDKSPVQRLGTKIIGVSVLTIGISAGWMGLGYAAMGGLIPFRSWMPLNFVLFAGLGIVSYCVGLSLRANRVLNTIPKTPFIIALLFLFTVVSSIHALQLSSDLRQYAAGADSRQEQIFAQSNQTSPIIVPRLEHNILDLEDVEEDPAYWVNTCIAEFYHVYQVQSAQ